MSRDFFSPNEMNRALEAAFPSIWRFAIALTKNKPDADDLTQSTCIRAIERREQFEKGGNFGAWCKTICRSIWLNQMRADKVRQTQAIDTVPQAALKELSPDSETNIFAAQVFSEVMALPQAQRETVILVYSEGYSYSEAAQILDVPIGTVMSRLSAARAKLGWMQWDDTAKRKER